MMEEPREWYGQHKSSLKTVYTEIAELKLSIKKLVERIEVLERTVNATLHNHHSDGRPS